MLKIDCHAHIMPPSWPSLKDKYGYNGWIQLKDADGGAEGVEGNGNKHMVHDSGTHFREVQPNCFDPSFILKDMAEHRVDVMVLCTIPVLFNYWAKPADTLDWSRFLNDHLAGVVADHPQRFIGLGTVPMQDVDLAIKEMRRCRMELGMPGLEIGSNINGLNLDDKAFFPFWEAAQDLNMSIFIHPWEMLGGERLGRYWGQWLVGMPAETTQAITSMIFGGVFDTFPDLKVMFAHAGGAFPFTVGRISHGWNVRPDLVNIHQVNDPRSYIGKFWVDSITHDRQALNYLVSVMGSDRIAYGTDYPFPLGDLEHGAMIEGMGELPPTVKQRLFEGNILEFLGLKAGDFLRTDE